MQLLRLALITGCGAVVKAAPATKATAIVFPSRVTTCRAHRAAWSGLKFGSIIVDDQAQAEGVSAALDGQTWSLINHRPLVSGGIQWPEVCDDLDEVIEFILEQAITASSDAVANIGRYIDQHIRTIDGDIANFNFEQLAQKYAGAALVTPYALIIPGCVHPPQGVRAQALDFQNYIASVLKVIKNQKPCASCLARLVTEIFEIVRDGPADLEKVEEVVTALVDGSKKVADTIQALEQAGDLPSSLGGLLSDALPQFIGSMKAGVGEGKSQAFLGFLGKVKDEIKSEEVPRIDQAVEKYLKAQGC